MNILDNYQRSSHPLHLIRHHLRALIYASSKTKFIAKISQTENVQKFFHNSPALIDLPLKRYLDNRWSVSQRYAALSVDFENAYQKFDDNLFNDIIQNTSIKIFDLGVYAIYLELNTVCLWEGFWALSIKDLSNKTIYNLSFAFLSNNTILISSVQGIRVNDNNEYEQQRSVTKMTFGLRPPNLLVTMLQTLCKPWGIENLLGIDPKFIGTKKYFGFANEFKFGYDNFWKELEGIETTQGYWQIPSVIPIKDLDEVSSNKRSKYRNRNLLLDRLLANCQELFPSKHSVASTSRAIDARDAVEKSNIEILQPTLKEKTL